MAVEFRVLGEVGVRIDGRPIDVGHARQQCVLVALLAEASRPVPADELLDRAWGSHHLPQRGRAALHSYVSRLRGILASADDAGIVRRPGGYLLRVDPMAVDLHRFGSLVDRARDGAADEPAGDLLDQALGLWRGVAFGALDTPWLNELRATATRQRRAAELDRYDIALRRGEHAWLLDVLSTAVSADPWDERLAGQLMLALYRCGRQAEAMALYRQLHGRLAAELGADPGAPLQRLHQQILTADPAVAAPQPAPARTATGPAQPPAERAPAERVPAVPRQLPASPGAFTGRATELAELSRQLGDPARTAAVVISAIGGIGGVGKTWLALRWAHANAQHFPDGQLYVNLRGFDPGAGPVPWPVAVRGFLDALGVDPGRVPADPQAQVGLYRSLVAGRQLLIVLDNARDTDTVAQLLPGAGGNAVVVTSRHQLPGLVAGHGARPMTLDLLPDADARELLARQLGAARISAEPATIVELIEHCAGLPLALGIVAARAALRPDRPLADIAAQLRAAGTRLDALDAGELSVNLRAVLSCSVAALTPAAAEVFALVGLAPGPDLSLAAAASLAGRSTAATGGLLRQLGTANLIQEHAPGRYRMHDLVRLYAVELAAGPDPTGATDPAGRALRRLLDHYLHTAHGGALLLSPQRDPLPLTVAADGVAAEQFDHLDAALAWFTAEHPVLLAAVRRAGTAGFDRHAAALAWTLATFFDRQGHWDDWVAVGQVAVDAAGRLADRAVQAQAHRLLANAYSNLRRYDETHAHLRHALGRFEELGDAAGCAHVHFDIAMLFDRQGQPARALPAARRSLELYRLAGTAVQQAVALNAIGWYHSQLGEHRTGIGYCEQALALAKEVGSQYGQANTWDSLGYAHHHLGEHQRAAACYTEALDLFRAMGDRHAEGIVLVHLGDSHDAAGDRAAARDAWGTAQPILDDLAHPEAAAVRAKLG